MFTGIGPMEMIIIVLVLLLLFGGKEMPKVVKTVLKAWKDLQRSSQSIRKEIDDLINNDDFNG